ncbi:unnamed protein product [Trichobilharzia szidati]|nr:unnamed protein product [Trichobilharzia szidati]
MANTTKYLLPGTNDNMIPFGNQLAPSSCIMYELSSINRNPSVNETNPLKRHLSVRVRIYHYCVLFTSVFGLISISTASVIFYLHTGYNLNQERYQVNIVQMSKDVREFFTYAKWISLCIFCFGLLLLCISIILCYFHKSFTSSSSSIRHDHQRISTNTSNIQAPTIVHNTSNNSSNHCLISVSTSQV